MQDVPATPRVFTSPTGQSRTAAQRCKRHQEVGAARRSLARWLVRNRLASVHCAWPSIAVLVHFPGGAAGLPDSVLVTHTQTATHTTDIRQPHATPPAAWCVTRTKSVRQVAPQATTKPHPQLHGVWQSSCMAAVPLGIHMEYNDTPVHPDASGRGQGNRKPA